MAALIQSLFNIFSSQEDVIDEPYEVVKRRSDYDVTDTVCVTDSKAVSKEVCRLYSLLYPSASTEKIAQAFNDLALIYSGDYPDYHASETPYHDIQHSLDGVLCMVRILSGYNASEPEMNRIDSSLAELGIIVSLFCDVGYIRHHDDQFTPNGAVYTSSHVTRGGEFLSEYLHKLELDHHVALAKKLIHFTGYEVEVAKIQSESYKHKMLGYIIGSADLVSQLADRCYLEKCSERLYVEFVYAKLVRPETGGEAGVDYIFDSRDDLMKMTTHFITFSIEKRLEETLGGVHNHLATFFGGTNPYLEFMKKNEKYLASQLARGGWRRALRRTLPNPLIK